MTQYFFHYYFVAEYWQNSTGKLSCACNSCKYSRTNILTQFERGLVYCKFVEQFIYWITVLVYCFFFLMKCQLYASYLAKNFFEIGVYCFGHIFIAFVIILVVDLSMKVLFLMAAKGSSLFLLILLAHLIEEQSIFILLGSFIFW